MQELPSMESSSRIDGTHSEMLLWMHLLRIECARLILSGTTFRKSNDVFSAHQRRAVEQVLIVPHAAKIVWLLVEKLDFLVLNCKFSGRPKWIIDIDRFFPSSYAAAWVFNAHWTAMHGKAIHGHGHGKGKTRQPDKIDSDNLH